MTATPPRTLKIRTLLPPVFPLAAARPLPFGDGRSPASSASPLGSSTTKRYLHFGQSIFLPMRFGSRTGTDASQLGQATLKLVLAAIRHLRRGGPGLWLRAWTGLWAKPQNFHSRRTTGRIANRI